MRRYYYLDYNKPQMFVDKQREKPVLCPFNCFNPCIGYDCAAMSTAYADGLHETCGICLAVSR